MLLKTFKLGYYVLDLFATARKVEVRPRNGAPYLSFSDSRQQNLNILIYNEICSEQYTPTNPCLGICAPQKISKEQGYNNIEHYRTWRLIRKNQEDRSVFFLS